MVKVVVKGGGGGCGTVAPGGVVSTSTWVESGLQPLLFLALSLT